MKLKRWQLFLPLGAVLAWCVNYQVNQWAGNGPQDTSPGPPRKIIKYFATPWQSEAQFLVTAICSDLTGMVVWAGTSRSLGPEFRVEVTPQGEFSAYHPGFHLRAKLGAGKTVEADLKIEHSIWDPQAYVEWCQQVAEAVALQPGASGSASGSDKVIERLTDPQPKVLASLDRELSESGLQHMKEPEWHEQAALLVGSLALREPQGYFFELRRPLCRMTAHLALASWMRGKQQPSVCYQLARATLACLYRREDEANACLKDLPEAGAVGAWKRALTIRTTFDYRTSQPPGTLLEERERFQAEFTVGSCDGAWQHRRLQPGWEQLSDWTRLAYSKMSHTRDEPGVGTGHQLLELGMPAEMREVQQVWEGEGWGKPKELTEFVNAHPGWCLGGTLDKPQVAVLGKGLWGGFAQRQMCHVLAGNHHFLEDSWSVPEEARRFRAKVEKLSGKWELYPFLLRQLAVDEATYHRAVDTAGAVIRGNPERVPSYAFNSLFYPPEGLWRYTTPAITVLNEWHRNNPLPGTAYDLHPRMNHPSFINRNDFVTTLEELQAASPHDPVLYGHLLKTYENKGAPASPERLKAILDPVVSYNAEAAARLAMYGKLSQAESDKYLAIAAELNPRYYATVLERLEAAGDGSRYEETFKKWLAAEPDAVTLSNMCRPMVLIYEKSGRKAEATALAEQAADAYSATGLGTKGDLLESRGDTAGALDCYARIAERYDDRGPLLGGLLRMAQKSPSLQPRLKQVCQQVSFSPSKFQAPADSSPPHSGLEVTANMADLKEGDIVVAIRGYRVENESQYLLVRDFSLFEPFSLVVFRKGKYEELGPFEAGHRFGNLQDYSG